MFRSLFSKKILVNSLHLILERGLKLALGLFVGVYVMRYLGPDRYGMFSYVASLAGLLLPFAQLGYPTVAVKEIVQQPGNEQGVLGATLGLNVFASGLIFLVLNLLALFYLDQDTRPLLQILSLQLLFSPAKTVDVYFQSVVKARYPVLARSTGQLLSAGLRLAAIFLSAGLVWFVAIQSAVGLIVAALLVYSYYHYASIPLSAWHYDRVAARRIFLLSIPLVLTNLFNVVILRIDQVLIRQLLDNTETGIYAAAATLSEAWYFLPGAFLASLFPALVKEHGRSRPGYFAKMEKLCVMFFYLALIIATVFYFLSDWAVPLLLGEKYSRSTEILVIHVWAGCFVFLGRPATKGLIIDDLNSYYLIVRLLAAGINIGLNYLLIPQMGIIGAAYATLVAYAVAHCFGYALFRPTRPYFWMQLRAVAWPVRSVLGMHIPTPPQN